MQNLSQDSDNLVSECKNLEIEFINAKEKLNCDMGLNDDLCDIDIDKVTKEMKAKQQTIKSKRQKMGELAEESKAVLEFFNKYNTIKSTITESLNQT